MFNRIRGRIGSAHVLGMVAVILALTGTSFALPGRNSVDSGDIRNRTIQAADVRPNAFGGGQINENRLGRVRLATAALDAKNVLWVDVKNPNGAKNAAVTQAGQPNTLAGEGAGFVNVAFARPVSACSWTGTSQGGGFVQVNPKKSASNVVTVRVRNNAGNLVDEPFSLQVVC